MGVLLVKCPTTGKNFSIGVYTDREALAGLNAIVTASICPHCGAEHAWRLEEARYVDAITPDRGLENTDTSLDGKAAE